MANKIAIVTLFPEMFSALTDYGISSRAINQGLLEVYFSNPRDFTADRHQTVDDRPYGGGPGMVMKVEPLSQAIAGARSWLAHGKQVGDSVESAKVIYLSPQGRLLSQAQVKTIAQDKAYQNIILVAGRYEGVDERLLEAEVDEEWSIGDYVLSGGELPAMVLMDAVIRLLPKALGHEDSADQDSFSHGLLDCPHYTRPDEYQGRSVPSVLLSGNHKDIQQWRLQQSLGRTLLRRPELLEKIELTSEQAKLMEAFKTSINKS
ncbi:MAG: tRNA (guanine37-N1)-methyltransferase [Cellvibrionaceae bacterium]|jgi:tRNA (guanine37-N1)-methyltransferase